MKERTRKGQFRSTETIAYKMTQHHGFDQVSWLAFQEAAAEKYDFATCQRADGSYYGTGGTCRKGTPTTLPDRKGAGKKKSGEGGGSLTKSATGTSVPGPKSANPGKVAKSAAAELEKKTGTKLSVQAPVRISKSEVMSAFMDSNGKAYMANMSHNGKNWNIDSFKGIG